MSVIEALYRRYERLRERGELPEPGLVFARIDFEIVLNSDGELVRLALLDRDEPLAVPGLDVTRTSAIVANTLWDKTEYLLGLTLIEEKDETGKKVTRVGQGKRTPAEHAASVEHHRALIGDSDDEGLRAVMRFFERWSPEQFDEAVHDREIVSRNGVFRLEGDADDNGRRRFVHQRHAARPLWVPDDEKDGEARTRCLVTGEVAPIARSHTPIKGVRGAQSSGAPLVSFNESAYTSHSWEQGANAPVSKRIVRGYTTALNALLAYGSGRNALVGNATVAFWADANELDEVDEKASEALVAELVGAPAATQAESEATDADPWAGLGDNDLEDETSADVDRASGPTLRSIVADLGRGLPIEGPMGRLDPRARIHLLGLSPNKSRLSVRYWYVDTLGAVATNVAMHWEDMALKEESDVPPPATPAQLVREAARHVFDEKVGRWKVPKESSPPPRLSGELLRAVLEGTRYPRALLSMLLIRVRAERGRVTRHRAALLKAIYNRNVARRREEENNEEHTIDSEGDPPSALSGRRLAVSLDEERIDPPYLLGRLFALYEWAEDSAAGGVRRNATLRDRYFATASTAPIRVFATLEVSYGHDLSKLRKSPSTKGFATKIDRRVTAVAGSLPVEMPRTLSGEDQARFIVGYYHQRQARFTSSKATSDNADEAASNDSDDVSEEEDR